MRPAIMFKVSGIGPLNRHTRKVIIMDQQTWVPLAGIILSIAALFITVTTLLRSMKRDIHYEVAEIKDNMAAQRQEMATLRQDLQTGLADQRQEFQTGLADVRRTMEQGFALIDGKLTNLEQRTYDQNPGPSAQTG